MKEIPILFSTPMVQAILAGRKTQTRRVVKQQPPKDYDYSGTDTDKSSGESVFYACWEGSNFHNVKCPYGQPGDVLWVRETFMRMPREGFFNYKAHHPIFKYADDKIQLLKEFGLKWKPSIHMPKEAASTAAAMVTPSTVRICIPLFGEPG